MKRALKKIYFPINYLKMRSSMNTNINQNKKIGHLKWKKLKELCKKKDNKENEIFIIYKSNIKNINYTNI